MNPRFSALEHRKKAMTAMLIAENAMIDPTVEISFPWPPKELSPNGRGHWAKKAKDVRAYKTTCIALCHVANLHLKKHDLASNGLAIRVTYEFYPPSKRKYDKDNCIAQIKTLQDAIEAVIGIDDNHFVTTHILRPYDHAGGSVDVKIERAE
jgi:crossover junction endodeoxyribonuclease RusA